MTAQSQAASAGPKVWAKIAKQYIRPRMSASMWQVANSFIPFFILFALMYLALDVSYLLTVALAILASGFIVRIFIIQHDCGHGSFFKSQRANDILGNICAIISLNPYEWWRHGHALHHAHNGDLEHRGVGDVFMMTLDEYRNANRSKRFFYHLYRYPLVMFGIGPVLQFVVLNRSPFALPRARNRSDALSILRLDFFLLIGLVIAHFTIGLEAVILMYLPLAFFTSFFGVWLFYVQHQFEDVYFSRKPEWDFAEAAMHGSTFYKLPKILQWFSGNIGFHHIHHLNPRIPNYELERCHTENEIFQDTVVITLWDSIKIVASRLNLYDEENGRMITYKQAYEILRAEKAAKSQEALPAVAPVQAGD